MDTFFRTLTLAAVAIMALRAEPLKVVCFGDSTTAPRPGVFTYCASLEKEYTAGGRAAITNRGVPADTTVKARARFQRDVLSLHPGLVFIQFGLNDSAIDVWKNPPADRPRVSVDEYRDNLLYFVNALHATGARVVLMTFNPMHWTPKLKELYGKPPYRSEEADGIDVGRSEYLEVIHHLATEKRVELVDVNAVYVAYAAAPGHSLQDLLLDGIHPNTLGHTITTSLVRPVLEATLKNKEKQ
jgi:lysophospholipase L1-like esterase